MGELLEQSGAERFYVQPPIIIESTEKLELQEKCGIVGIYSPSPKDQLGVTLLAAGGVQHRGQNGVGLASWSSTDSRYVAKEGLIKEVFTPDVVAANTLKTNWTLFHCRYGTDGGYGEENLQPVRAKGPDGKAVWVVHNGQFVEIDKMRSMLKNTVSDETSDTVIFTNLLAHEEGNNWDEKIVNTLLKVKGAYSLIIGVDGALYAARDEFGIRPLVLGNVPGHGYMVASESFAFDKVGGHVIRQINPGEVLRIDANGLTVIRSGDGSHVNDHPCDLEAAYFSHPITRRPIVDGASSNDVTHWEPYYSFRYACGQVAAKEYPIQADFVVGLPDSGTAFAQGYAAALKLPYNQQILRDHFDPNGLKRTFLADAEKSSIAEKVMSRLLIIPDRTLWEDKVVVLCDDSMIRGNVSGEITRVLKSLGVREVHWIIGFPHVIDRCHLGVSMRTDVELISFRQHSDDKLIAQNIGATSVHFISPIGFLSARKHIHDIVEPQDSKHIFLENHACGGCVTGIHPIGVDGEIYQRESSIEKSEIHQI